MPSSSRTRKMSDINQFKRGSPRNKLVSGSMYYGRSDAKEWICEYVDGKLRVLFARKTVGAPWTPARSQTHISPKTTIWWRLNKEKLTPHITREYPSVRYSRRRR